MGGSRSVASGGVDVWRVDLDAGPDGVAPAADEVGRAGRLRDDMAGARFLASRAWLRAVLAGYVGVEPEAIRFVLTVRGKPSLAGGGDICFSLSRSAAVGLIAVTHGRAVGVDLEQVRADADHESVARHLFTPAEVEALEQLAGPARGDAFFTLWTRKEAVLKATGAGIGDGLNGFDGRAEHIAGRWSVTSLDLGSGFAAAVATEGPLGPVSVRGGARGGRGPR